MTLALVAVANNLALVANLCHIGNQSVQIRVCKDIA
jgi:hypothetical protein